MALSNPQVHEVTTRLSGAMLVWFSYLDQNGKKYIFGPFKYPAGTNLVTEATNRLPYCRQEARQSEVNELLSRLVAGGNSLSIAQGPFVHVQQDQVVKQILRFAMSDPDPGSMLKIQNLMTYLNTNYPGDLLASFLGVPTAKVNTLRARYSAAIAADLQTLRGADEWQ